MRDWFLGLCLVWIAVSAVIAFADFRISAIVLGLCPITIAILRLSPTRFALAWSNRSRAFDALLSLAAGVALIVLAATVPGT